MTSIPNHIGFNGRFFSSNWRPARDEIAFARAADFSSIQFPGPEAGLTAERLGQPLAEVGVQCADAGIEPVMEVVVGLQADGRTRDGFTPLDVLRHNLPAIQALGCTRVHWHLVLKEAVAEAARRPLETSLTPQFEAAVQLGDEHRFQFGLEHNSADVPHPFFSDPDSVAAILTAVPGLGFVWDTNHTSLDQFADYLRLAPRLSLLHVSDTPLPALNHHRPLGLGNVRLTEYCRALLVAAFTGSVILEIGGAPWSGGFDQDTDEALRRSRQEWVGAWQTARAST